MKSLLAALCMLPLLACAQTFPSLDAPYTYTTAPRIVKVRVIILNFQDDSSAYAKEDYRQWIWQGAGSARALLSQWSRGDYVLQGRNSVDGSLDVFGPYTVPYSKTVCNDTAWVASAKAQAQAAGVVLTGIDHIVYVWKDVDACTWAGRMLNSNVHMRAPGISMASGEPVTVTAEAMIAHELLHVQHSHSNGYLCVSGGSRVSMGTTSECTSTEYAHPYDVMGARQADAPSAYIKMRWGWLAPNEWLLNPCAGTYELEPHDITPGGLQLIAIDRGNVSEFVRYLWIDYRQGIGVLLHVAAGHQYRDDISLIDTHPGTALPSDPVAHEFEDAPLQPGDQWTDPVSGYTIRFDSISAGKAVVVLTR